MPITKNPKISTRATPWNQPFETIIGRRSADWRSDKSDLRLMLPPNGCIASRK
jgi:hypothetical protein